eukprot:scaffold1455_cov65-Phaeocystis_antarctica.AAC.7
MHHVHAGVAHPHALAASVDADAVQLAAAPRDAPAVARRQQLLQRRAVEREHLHAPIGLAAHAFGGVDAAIGHIDAGGVGELARRRTAPAKGATEGAILQAVHVHAMVPPGWPMTAPGRHCGAHPLLRSPEGRLAPSTGLPRAVGGQGSATVRTDELDPAAPRVGDEDLALVHREVTRLIHLARRAAAHLVWVRVRIRVRVRVRVRVHLARRAGLTGSPSSSSVAPMCRRKLRPSRSNTETRLLPHSATSSSSPATRRRARGSAQGAHGGAGETAVAWHGVAWRGVAWRGVAWRGVAWRGVAWRGVAWRGVGAAAPESTTHCGPCSSPSPLPRPPTSLRSLPSERRRHETRCAPVDSAT